MVSTSYIKMFSRAEVQREEKSAKTRGRMRAIRNTDYLLIVAAILRATVDFCRTTTTRVYTDFGMLRSQIIAPLS
jgi:hypothetical protein